MGLHALRVRAAHAMTTRRRAALASALIPEDKATFDWDGVVEICDFPSEEQFQSLRTQFHAYREQVRETVQGDATTRRIAMDRHAKTAIPAFAHFQDHFRWRALAKYVAGFDLEPLLYLQSICLNAMTLHRKRGLTAALHGAH